MERHRLDILGLSETRLTGFGEKRTNDGYTLLYSGREDDVHSEGVALLLGYKVKKFLTERHRVSERVIVARFARRARRVSIVQCYASRKVSDEEDKEQFYSKVRQAMRNCRNKDIFILMGDLNATVRNDKQGSYHWTKPSECGTTTETDCWTCAACSS